jgi:pantoate--beta-alanine ligase
MQLASTREQVREVTLGWRRQGLKTALVPTMGNLHDGHLALVDAARRKSDRVVTSIFVNPTQFGPGEDFESYPRTLAADRERLERAGCDLLFLPDQGAMYPFGLQNQVRVLAAADLAADLEGRVRPGHFDGVTTVVARLFNLVNPDIAIFGEKDYQQLLVIRRMVADLGFAVEVLSVPTVREESGLAMSSRNSYLEAAQRKAAGVLHEVLRDAAQQVESGMQDLSQIENGAVAQLEHEGFRVEYLAVRDAASLSRPGPSDRHLRILVAAVFGRTRLIDNIGVNRLGIP